MLKIITNHELILCHKCHHDINDHKIETWSDLTCWTQTTLTKEEWINLIHSPETPPTTKVCLCKQTPSDIAIHYAKTQLANTTPNSKTT